MQVPGAEGAATSPVHCSPSRDGPLLPLAPRVPGTSLTAPPGAEEEQEGREGP